MIEPDALARALADAYRLRVTGLSPLEGGSLNAGYRVEATDGDFHVKCYDGRIYQADAVRRSLAAREYVGRSEVPVPAVRLNIDGDAITDVPRVGSVVLSTFIAGRHHQRGSIPARAAGAMGRMLGRLHHILARFGEPRPYAAPPPAEAQTRLEGVLRTASWWRSRMFSASKSLRPRTVPRSRAVRSSRDSIIVAIIAGTGAKRPARLLGPHSPHRTLCLETPEPGVRSTTGSIRASPVLGGLHHVYERVA